MQARTAGFSGMTTACLFILGGILLQPPTAGAATITFSGSVGYTGSYTGDSLYVAILDTAGVEDVDILAIQAYDVGAPPFNQAFSLDFDNVGAGAMLLVASFLDVDGAGADSISGDDILGWYSGGSSPTGVSSSANQSGLDFDLPLAEIQGIVTFAPGQTSADIQVTDDVACVMEGFRPKLELTSAGAYAIRGIYAGTYCVWGDGSDGGGFLKVCFGDPLCMNPTAITLGAAEVRMGIDLDFNDVVPAMKTTWGRIKSKYP